MTVTATTLSPTQLKQARRFAIQFVYQQDANQQLFFQHNVFEHFCDQLEVPTEERSFLRELAKGVLDRIQEIDAHIEQNAKNWKFSRIAKVDLAILRVCTLGLAERADISKEVVISDAAEIGKQYGAENSGAFINGLLDAIARIVRKS